MRLHKRIRRDRLREECLARDQRCCKVCGIRVGHVDAYGDIMRVSSFEVHHITPRVSMPNGGNVAENCITLCPPCHEDAEAYLQGDVRSGPHTKAWEDFMPSSLYAKIGSCYDKATYLSERL